MIPMEEIVVIPDLYEASEQMLPAHEGFTQFLQNYGFGWKHPMNLVRVVHRPDAEPVPNPRGERIRQLIANILVFIIPDELYVRIHKQNKIEDFELISNVLDQAQLFASVKLAGSGEVRLHGKLACGFGGHVDAADLRNMRADHANRIQLDPIDDLIHIAAVREIAEELEVNSNQGDERAMGDCANQGIIPLGVINSSCTEVETVHIGMINVMAVPESIGIQIREKDKLQPVTIPLRDLKNTQMLEEQYVLDTWTKIIFSSSSLMLANRIITSIQSTR